MVSQTTRESPLPSEVPQQRHCGRPKTLRRHTPKRYFRPWLEPLEDRCLLTLFTGPFGPGQTWNVYEVVRSPETWTNANAIANASAFRRAPGHLVSIHSDHENNFVRYIAVGINQYWTGLTDSEAHGGVETGRDSTVARTLGMPGQPAGWVWTSGEPYTYENFAAGEPNDVNGEDAVLVVNGNWSDRGNGEPGQNPFDAKAYIIEYETNLTEPAEGITRSPFAAILPPRGSLPPSLALGGQGTVGVTEVAAMLPSPTLREAIHRASYEIDRNTNNVRRGTSPGINFHDPETKLNGSPVGTNSRPFLSNTPLNDDRIQAFYVAKIRVTEEQAGPWTIGFQSDDGFALRLEGAAFSAVYGEGLIDPMHARSLIHDWPTGNSLTLGVAELPAGEYELHAAYFESRFGATVSVFAAPGAFQDLNFTPLPGQAPGADPPHEFLELCDAGGLACLPADPPTPVGTNYVIDVTPASTSPNDTPIDLVAWQDGTCVVNRTAGGSEVLCFGSDAQGPVVLGGFAARSMATDGARLFIAGTTDETLLAVLDPANPTQVVFNALSDIEVFDQMEYQDGSLYGLSATRFCRVPLAPVGTECTAPFSYDAAHFSISEPFVYVAGTKLDAASKPGGVGADGGHDRDVVIEKRNLPDPNELIFTDTHAIAGDQFTPRLVASPDAVELFVNSTTTIPGHNATSTVLPLRFVVSASDPSQVFMEGQLDPEFFGEVVDLVKIHADQQPRFGGDTSLFLSNVLNEYGPSSESGHNGYDNAFFSTFSPDVPIVAGEGVVLGSLANDRGVAAAVTGTGFSFLVDAGSNNLDFSVLPAEGPALITVSLPLVGEDFGDAPDPGYPTLLASNGARHTLGGPLYLGAGVDAEPDGQPNGVADGDDHDTLHGGFSLPHPPGDEDGVVFIPWLTPGEVLNLTVISSAPGGLLNAWVDFNANGSWADAGEQIFADEPLPIVGPNALSFTVPATAAFESFTYFRFRVDSGGGLSFDGPAADGEVEDYQVTIGSSSLDFGDAPPPYPTLRAHNGARHAFTGMFLGNVIDVELDGQPNATATGDDSDRDDSDSFGPDEDGVHFANLPLTSGALETVTVKATGPGLLNAWIDFNDNGSWDDSGEQIFTDEPLVDGDNSLSFPVPTGIRATPQTFARFRFNQDGGLNFDGFAPDGEVEDYEVSIDTPLQVMSVFGTGNGVEVQFNAPFDVDPLSSDDVTLTGPISGPVVGSFVLDDGTRVVFVATGNPLIADTYTMTLHSAEDAFRKGGGNLLDGDGDGVPGGDFTANFTIDPSAPGTVTVGVADFVRGPDQELNQPANSTDGIPITMDSNAAAIRNVTFAIDHNPNLLSITGVTPGASMPVDSTANVDTSTPGRAVISFSSPTDLPAGANQLVNLQAMVPTDNAASIYGNQHLLDINSITLTNSAGAEVPAIDNDGLHVVAFFGDVSGNGGINASDASQVARVAASLDSGFAEFPRTDPMIVGDISGNGVINAMDASMVARHAVELPVDQIPPIPSGAAVAGSGLPNAKQGLARIPATPVRAPVTIHDRPEVAPIPAALGFEEPGAAPRRAVDAVMASLDQSGPGDEEEELPPALEDAVEELLSASLTLATE